MVTETKNLYDYYNLSPSPLNPESECKQIVDNIQGLSLSGNQTCIIHKELKVAFDMGVVPDFALKANTVLISHGHMDHCGGVHQHMSRRNLTRQPAASYLVPSNTKPSLDKWLGAASELNGADIQGGCSTTGALLEFDLNTAEPIKKDDKIITPFKTTHRVPSCGYMVSQKSKKLKSGYENLSPEELTYIKSNKIDLTESYERNIIAYTGDTTIDFLKTFNYKVETLIMEMTFICEKTLENSMKHTHIHLDHVVANAEKLYNSCENIVFTHFSARYSEEFIRIILNKKLPKDLLNKTLILR